jgi:sugar diacid utilization regulator
VARAATERLQALIRIRPEGGAGTYRELALASTLLADRVRAGRFARAVLGPLAADTAEAERLRATLRASFARQENKAAAGARLRIHEKTVAYRLRRAAALVGGPVEGRRAELEAALMVLAR